jgi:hypothetical protein
MTDLTFKYNLLDNSSRKEVLDFLDFLLGKRETEIKHKTEDYKKKILNVSVWSDSDIDEMKKNIQQFGQWKAQEW